MVSDDGKKVKRQNPLTETEMEEVKVGPLCFLSVLGQLHSIYFIIFQIINDP